jgi:ribosomal protein L27
VRQRGTRFHPGDGVGMVRAFPQPAGLCARNNRFRCALTSRLVRSAQGKDHTIFATIVGNVRFKRDTHRSRTFISVEEEPTQALASA